MATNITAGNATNGAAISSDNTGTLAIKTGTGAGTTAISIDASQVVTLPGNLVVTGTATVGGIPVGGNYVLVQYTSPATGPAAWDANTKKAAGLKAIKVTVVGGGGNGGSVTAPAGGGGGGGGGGAAIEYIPAPSIPGPVDITAGPGTNSFGAFCSATGGSNGANGISPAATPVAGGAGGAGSGGGINQPGSAGSPNAIFANQSNFGGFGGSSALFTSFVFGTGPTVAGTPSTVIGGGGSGAGLRAAGSGAGGTGGPGIVIVEEFY